MSLLSKIGVFMGLAVFSAMAIAGGPPFHYRADNMSLAPDGAIHLGGHVVVQWSREDMKFTSTKATITGGDPVEARMEGAALRSL